MSYCKTPWALYLLSRSISGVYLHLRISRLFMMFVFLKSISVVSKFLKIYKCHIELYVSSGHIFTNVIMVFRSGLLAMRLVQIFVSSLKRCNNIDWSVVFQYLDQSCSLLVSFETYDYI